MLVFMHGYVNVKIFGAEMITVIIEDLGINPTEQEQLEVLREFPKKEKKTTQPKAPSLESLKLWEVEGISRRTWYSRRRKEREVKARWEQVQRQYIAIAIERIVNELCAEKVYDCTARAYIMRGIECVYVYEEDKWCIGCIVPLWGVLYFSNRLQRLSVTAVVKDDEAYTALVGKTQRDHTALTTDKRISGGEALKLSTPPPNFSNRLQRLSVTAVVKDDEAYTARLMVYCYLVDADVPCLLSLAWLCILSLRLSLLASLPVCTSASLVALARDLFVLGCTS